MKNKGLFKTFTLIALAVMVIASTITTKVDAKIVESKIGIVINDEIKPMPADMGQPFIDNRSRTFVPLRFVSENLGYKVEWDQKTKTATIKHSSGDILVQIGNDKISTPSGEVAMDVEAFIKDSRTYVPVRFVAEALGFKVDWVSAKNIEGYKKYNYDFYVAIEGKLGENIQKPEDNGTGITNKVSNNPKDWPETPNQYQKHFDLAKNSELVDYLNTNYEGQFVMAGYTTYPEEMGPALGFDHQHGMHSSYGIMPLRIYDLRKTDGYWEIAVRWYEPAKDVLEKSLFAIAGQSDGKYIADKFDEAWVSKATKGIIDKWQKAPNGTEFMLKNAISGAEILIK